MGNNGNFFSWFIVFWVVSAIVQVLFFVISARRDKKNELLHKFYCDFYEYIKDETVISGLCHEMIKFRSLGKDGDCTSVFVLKNDFYVKHFLKQKPSLFKNTSFYLNDCYVDRAYWWNISDESTKQRKLFIKMLIEKTSPAKNGFYESI